MTFNLSADQIWTGYKALVNFYSHLDDPFNSFPGFQHIIFFIAFFWWVTHPRTENRRFWPGYFAFTFLAVCGTMAHAKELTGGKVDFGLWELIFFLLTVGWIWAAWKPKSFFQIVNVWWRWWVIIPLIIGLGYPVSISNFPLSLKDFFLSPYSLWPGPTLIVLLSILGLAKNLPNLWITGFTALVGMYFGIIGISRIFIIWDWSLVIISAYVLVLVIKNFYQEVKSEKN